MKKFKIISTFGALILMVALFAFGVYAATEVKFTISGTVSFTVTNVYIRAYAGVGENVGAIADADYYYSQPASNQKNISALTTFAGWTSEGKIFKDNDDDKDSTYYCYLVVESMQGQDIYVKFGYEWSNTSKYNTSNTANAVTIAVSETTTRSGVSEKTHNPTYIQDATTTGKQTAKGGDANFVKLEPKEVKTFKITLTFKNEAMVYKLTDGSLKLTFEAQLDGTTPSA